MTDLKTETCFALPGFKHERSNAEGYSDLVYRFLC